MSDDPADHPAVEAVDPADHPAVEAVDPADHPAEDAVEETDSDSTESADNAASAEGDEVADGAKPSKKRPGRKRQGKSRPDKPRLSAREWFARNKKKAAIGAVAAFVTAGAFAGATAGPYLMDRATVATKLTIARTAADAINTLWSYTPEDMDRLPDRSARYLGGDFEEQYRKYVDAIAATNKQAKVTSSTKVVGAAVESLRPEANEATAIVYTNTTSTSPQSNNIPSMKYLSYRLELKRYGRDWRVTKMTTVTSLDLTPKLGM